MPFLGCFFLKVWSQGSRLVMSRDFFGACLNGMMWIWKWDTLILRVYSWCFPKILFFEMFLNPLRPKQKLTWNPNMKVLVSDDFAVKISSFQSEGDVPVLCRLGAGLLLPGEPHGWGCWCAGTQVRHWWGESCRFGDLVVLPVTSGASLVAVYSIIIYVYICIFSNAANG